uniref:Wall-associated receptor kinase galacturonan-binding domain-containing protein n=1 Tax=Setaria italica TaxID=4555 RepID=K3ZCF2_SETIT
MSKIVLVVSAALVSAAQLLLAAAAGQIGLPGCATACEDPGCYLPGFNLTCDTSRTPARLSLGGDGTLQVTEIFLDNATVRVHGPAIDRDVRSPALAASTWGGQAWGLGGDAPYVLWAAENELVVTGCDLFVDLRLAGDGLVISSCGLHHRSSVCTIWRQEGVRCRQIRRWHRNGVRLGRSVDGRVALVSEAAWCRLRTTRADGSLAVDSGPTCQ